MQKCVDCDRPTKETIKTVIDFLESLGLRISGEYSSLDYGVNIGGINCSIEDIIELYDHIKQGVSDEK